MKFWCAAIAVLSIFTVWGSSAAQDTGHADRADETPAAASSPAFPSTAFPQRFWQREPATALSAPEFAPAPKRNPAFAPLAEVGDTPIIGPASTPNYATDPLTAPVAFTAAPSPAMDADAGIATTPVAAAAAPIVKPARIAPAPKPVQKPAPRAAAVASTPATSTIKGRMTLAAGASQKISAGEVSDGLVYFLPRYGAAKPKPGRFTIGTHSKGFTPNLLVVPIGSTVSFPNRDTILHNVYSRTPGATFDLATFGPGESRQTVFNKAGLVIVNCNVHHSMRANVVVLSTPYYTRPRKDGSFELEALPPGPGSLVFWHPRSSAATVAIGNGPVAPMVQPLVASKPRLDAHLMVGK